MARTIYFLSIVSILTLCKCNLWDNLFSNLKNPNVEIPEEFRLDLYNSENYLIKSAEILVSVKQNKIKLTLYDTLKIENTFETLVKLLLNKTDDEMMHPKELANVVIDFNKNSRIIMNSPKRNICEYKKVEDLNLVGVKFLLASYDLVTYYKDKNPNHTDYVFTNPSTYTNLRNDKLIKYLIFGKELGTVEKNALIVLRISRQTNNINDIGLKFDNYEYYNFKAKLNIFDKINESEFNVNTGKECVEVTDDKTVMDFLMQELTRIK